jgi:hypothetical protein
MNKYHTLIIALFIIIATGANSAEPFIKFRTFTINRTKNSVCYEAKVDFPVSGNAAAMRGARKWICNILELDNPKTISESNFESLLNRSCEQYLKDVDATSRRVRIALTFEDPTCVTFESMVEDDDTVKWRTADCASFSKRDGHLIKVNEIFKCPDSQIKKLMWQFRGDLPEDITSPSALAIGNTAFIDGWIIVIGPVRNGCGAEYRIRYATAEPYLKVPKSGGYY